MINRKEIIFPVVEKGNKEYLADHIKVLINNQVIFNGDGKNHFDLILKYGITPQLAAKGLLLEF